MAVLPGHGWAKFMTLSKEHCSFAEILHGLLISPFGERNLIWVIMDPRMSAV